MERSEALASHLETKDNVFKNLATKKRLHYMTEETDAIDSQDQAQIKPSKLVKAYIDQEESQPKKKKWRNSWRSASPITKAGVVLTAAVAAATIAYSIIAGWQLRLMSQASIDNAAQTQRLIDAANRMDHAADSFSQSASGINSGVSDAVAKLQSQADKLDASRRSADKNSAASLHATIDSFHREERAWIGIANAKPLSYTPDIAAKSANMIVAFTLRNYGRSAAEYVRFLAVLESDPTVTTLSCDEVATKNHIGDVLLPTQERTLNWVMNLTSDQMLKGWAHQNPQLGHQLELKIVGCIEYTDRDDELPSHRTPFTYLVIGQGGFITPDNPIPGEELSLEPIGTDSTQTH
jgi:hypothetical protein